MGGMLDLDLFFVSPDGHKIRLSFSEPLAQPDPFVQHVHILSPLGYALAEPPVATTDGPGVACVTAAEL